MTLPWILFTISAILLVIGVVILRNLLIKVERYEDIVTDQSTYIQNFSELISKSREKLKEVDEKGIFESDDEIGWFFSNIKELQELLDTFDIQKTYGQEKK